MRCESPDEYANIILDRPRHNDERISKNWILSDNLDIIKQYATHNTTIPNILPEEKWN